MQEQIVEQAQNMWKSTGQARCGRLRHEQAHTPLNRQRRATLGSGQPRTLACGQEHAAGHPEEQQETQPASRKCALDIDHVLPSGYCSHAHVQISLQLDQFKM